MKLFSLFSILVIVIVALVTPSQGTFCPCSGAKGAVCGTNKVTYNSRCEFECTQRQYRQIGKTLNVLKAGPCDGSA